MKKKIPIHVGNSPAKPVMIFDGDCAFCRAWIVRWQEWTGERVEYVPFRQAGVRFPEIPACAFERAVQYIEVNGEVFEGAEAVFRALAVRAGTQWLLWCYQKLPGWAAISEFMYRLVSRHRGIFSTLMRFLYGKRPGGPTFRSGSKSTD